MAALNKTYSIAFTLPDGTPEETLTAVKDAIDPVFVSVIRQYGGTITVGPASGSITDTPSDSG